MTQSLSQLGPVELTVLEFEANGFENEVAAELGDLARRGIISILDLVMVSKDDAGGVEVLELAENEQVKGYFADVEGEVMWLLSDEDVAAAADSIQSGAKGVIVVWENTWARNLSASVERSGGRVVVHSRLDRREVAAAMSEAEE